MNGATEVLMQRGRFQNITSPFLIQPSSSDPDTKHTLRSRPRPRTPCPQPYPYPYPSPLMMIMIFDVSSFPPGSWWPALCC